MEMVRASEGPRISKGRLFLIGRLARISRSSPLKRWLRHLGIGKLMPFLFNKYYSELSWQTGWSNLFKNNVGKGLEYWKRYRCFDEVTRLCSLSERSRVLDVGCGVSTVLHFLPGERFGIDPLADEYKKLYAYPPGITIQRGFGERIPFDDSFFDAVFCSNVLDHTTDPRQTLSEIRRVLKRGGCFVLTVELFEAAHERDLAHPHCFTRSGVAALLDGGFDVLLDKTLPWMLMMSFVDGSMREEGEQLIMVLRKT